MVKRDIRIIGGVTKIVEIENGKIVKIIGDYKRSKKKDDKITKKGCIENSSTENVISIDNIVNIAKSQTIYREPSRYKGKYIRINIGNMPGCTIDNHTLRRIEKIMNNFIEKRKFPSISDYIKDCISKWTELYILANDHKDIYCHVLESSSHKNIERMKFAVIHRFELDYIELLNILSSPDKYNKLIIFRDNFIRHIDMALLYAIDFTEFAQIKHDIILSITVRDIINILEREELIPKEYMKSIENKKFDKNKKNGGDFIVKLEDSTKDHYKDKIIKIILSAPTTLDDLQKNLMIYSIEDIFRKNKSQKDKKFEIMADYAFMCVKEWTNIYYNIYRNHTSNYRYMLEIENEKSICNNYINAIRKDNKLIPNFDNFCAERNLDKWFRENYRLFGFTAIKKSNIKNTDYLCNYINICICVELEYVSSNFILHGHDSDVIHLVICYKKDKDLNIPIIPILELSKEI